MAQEAEKIEKTSNHRYLTALALILLFILAAIMLDRLVNFIILVYFPYYANYTLYISESLNVVLGIFGAYVIYKVLVSIITLHERKEADARGSEAGKVILRILFYIVALSIILVSFGPSLGITLTQSLAGGAIGGIVIGLAVQTIVTSILSGFLISSSRTLIPGDVFVLHSTLWGDLMCKVVKVNVLFTEVITQTGNRMKLPNTTLFSSTTFTRLKQGNAYLYTIQISMPPDVQVTGLAKRVKAQLNQTLSKLKKTAPEIYLLSRSFDRNTFNVIINFSDFSEINSIIDITNKTFDDAYWALKNKRKR